MNFATTVTTHARRFRLHRLLSLIALAAAAGIVIPGGTRAVAADLIPVDYRVASGVGKFSNTSQFAVAFRTRAPEFLRSDRLELAVGTFSTSGRNRAFVSLGPVWRLPINSHRYFGEFGFSPTLLDGSTFDGRELGGNFHFTSSITLGMRFGVQNQYALALRAQHTSNGGLNSTNPGLDTVGINFSANFDRR